MKSVKSLRTKLWNLCKQITRLKYQNKDGSWNCYTCGVLMTEPKDVHTGHCIPRSTGGILLYYHLDNLRPQCRRCNLWKQGEGAIFMRNLLKEIGEKKVDALIKLKKQTAKADILFFESKIKEYELILRG